MCATLIHVTPPPFLCTQTEHTESFPMVVICLVLRLIENIFTPATPSRPNTAAANVSVNKRPPYAGKEHSNFFSHVKKRREKKVRNSYWTGVSWGHRVTVIESGKEDERDLDFLPQDIIILVVVEFKFVHFDPGFDAISTLLYWEEEIWGLMRSWRFLELRVIGVWVVKNRVHFSDSGKRSCV